MKPRRLVDVSERAIGIELFGRHQATPFMIGPTGLNGALWPKGDILLARAAERAGIAFVLSTASNASVEDVAAASKGDLWFQLCIVQRKLAEHMVRRAEAAGYNCRLEHRFPARDPSIQMSVNLDSVTCPLTYFVSPEQWRWAYLDGPAQ